jgi:phosphatidylinositol glycan class B
MVPRPFLLALAVKSISLLLPHTFFQPDEFYQAFEPAHHLIFGYGYLTWEWKDLPVGHMLNGSTSFGSWWIEHVDGGRMRSWLWPSIFAGVSKVIALLGLDETSLIVSWTFS